MATDPGQPTTTRSLEEARRRRADLHRALVDVERASSGPAAGRIHEWSSEVARRLRQLHQALEEHIAVTEQPGGLYEEILAQAPHLAAKVRRVGADLVWESYSVDIGSID
jgi:hypothetical protein